MGPDTSEGLHEGENASRAPRAPNLAQRQLVPLGVLDEFKSAGVFVNWWQQIRYDLKTNISIGWHHSLIPDEYLIAEFG